jgi:hypothetical protein
MPVVFNGVTSGMGQVVAIDRVRVPVSSDHAMIDSGYRTLVTLWDGTRSWTQALRDDDNSIDVAVDVSDEARAAYQEWKNVVAWVFEERQSYQRHLKTQQGFRAGDTVEVFKGRKAPKGTYTVINVGENSYGKYAFLQDGAGTIYRYVNLDNLRKQHQPWEALVAWTKDATAINLATAASKADTGYYSRAKRAQAYLVLADRLEELGLYQQAEVIRHVPEITERQAYPWENRGNGWVSLAEEPAPAAK